MAGFLDGVGTQSARPRGFLADAQTLAPEAIQPMDLDSILSSLGAERVKPVMQAIIGQESGGNAAIGNSVDGAHGPGQMMPDTFRRFAAPGERIDNPADNLRASARYINYLYDKTGGDPEKIAAGYFSGEGNIGATGAFKTDHKDGNGKSVSSYVADVMGRMGGPQAAQTAAGAPHGPKWSEVVKKPEYAALTPAEREQARSEYFDKYVAPDLDESEREAGKSMFLDKAKGMDPKEPGIMDRVGNFFSDLEKNARTATGNTPEQRAAVEKDARSIDLGVMGKFDPKDAKGAPEEAAIANVPASDKWKSDVRAQWDAATPAERATMAEAKTQRGYVFKQLNSLYKYRMPATTAEARASRLFRNGLDAKTAEATGRDAAARGVELGDEAGAGSASISNFDFEAQRKYNDPKSIFANPAVRGAVKGYEGFKTGAYGMGQFVADAGGFDGMAGAMSRATKESKGFTDAMGTPANFMQRNFEGAVSSIGQQLPAMIGGAVTGSEALVLGSMFAQTFGQEYGDGRSQGLEMGDAATRAGIFGAFEVVGEKFGLGFQLEAMRNAARGVPTDLLAGWLQNTVKKELPGELLTTTGQFLTDKLPEIGLNQDATFADYLHQMGDTAVQTFMQAGMMAGATNGAAHARNYVTDAGKRFTAEDAQAEAMGKWRRNGLAPSTRVEPTMDRHAAGLTPEQRAVDQTARDAFADLTGPSLLEDEIPASMVLGKEEAAPEGEKVQTGQKYVRVTNPDGTTGFALEPEAAPAEAAQTPATTEAQEPASVPAPEPTALDAAPAEAVPVGTAPEAKKTKLTPFTHPDLDDVEIRGELAYMADQAGWEQVGGKMIRADATDQGSDVTGRTPWIPKQPWYQMMPERLNEEDTIDAVGKALTGAPMTAKEKRVIANMLDFAKASLEDQQKWSQQAQDEVGATSPEEYAGIQSHADKLEDLDADIPFALDDARMKTLNTDEEIDHAFGIKQQSSRVSEKPAGGNAAQGTEGTRPAQGAGSETFDLQGETPAEVKAKVKQTEKTKAAERKAKADDEAKAKADETAKEIKRRATAAADNFQLGEDPEAALSGQKDIFAGSDKKINEAPPDSGKKVNPLQAEGSKKDNPATEKEAADKIAKSMDDHLAYIEKGIADGVTNATLAPDVGDPSASRTGWAKRQIAAYEAALKRAGWTYDAKEKEFVKDGAKLFLRSQGDNGSAIVQWRTKDYKYEQPAKKPAKPKTEKAAKAKKEAKAAPVAKDDDLDSMFDELMAEQTMSLPDRAAATVAKLRANGLDEMARIMEGGIASDVKHGQLTEDKVAFREKKALEEIAAKTDAGKPIPYEPMTAEKMVVTADAASALPPAIIDAAVARWNEYGPQLAKLGFSFGSVDARHPKAAQAIHRKMMDIVHALNGMAPRRYQAAKGHKNLNTEAVMRNEKFASDVLGIDTLAHPGIDTSSQVTLSGGVRPKAPKKTKKTERTAGEAAVSAAKNTATGLANAIDGLGALFGSGPGTLGSGPVFNEETYAKAKPLFQAAVTHLTDAASDIRDVMRAIIKMVSDKFGNETAANMKPYIVRFVSDYREGKFDAPPTSDNLEQDGANDAAQEQQRDNPVHGGPSESGPNDRGNVGKAPGARVRPAADLDVHDSGAPAGGTGSGNAVSEPAGELRVDRHDPQPDDAAGSGSNGTERTAATESEANDETPHHDGAPHVNELTFEEKLKAQKAAESIPVVMGDRKNIDATLPLLHEGQREDVHFAENRLSKPTGYGVLFTNGTGTGKTFLGLGIVKRMVASGKKNGIVIVPNQDVMNEWTDSAPALGLALHVLKDKQDAGKGVSITTYANFGDNQTLLDRAHDFVVADEAHKLMANSGAEDTKALDITRALTIHPDSAYTRTNMLHRELSNKINALRKEQNELPSDANGSMTRADAARAQEISNLLQPLEKEFFAHLKTQRELVAAVAPEARPRLVALSATPFAYEPNVQWANGYLFDYPKVKEVGSYNAPTPYQKFMIDNFGWHMKTGKLNQPKPEVDRALMQINFHERLKKAGVLSARRLDSNRDYDRKFILVDGGIGARIDAAMDWLRNTKDGIYREFYDQADKQFDFLTKSRLLEAIKAKEAIDIIKQHHAMGRKVVVFHDYNVGGGFQPFNFVGAPGAPIKAKAGYGIEAKEVTFTYGEFMDDFAKAFPDLVGDDLAKLKSPIETLREAFPQALFNNGLEKKSNAEKSVKTFRDDANPDANLLVVQSSKNEGWSAHDTSGKQMRVALNLGLPTAPSKSIQLEGRIYRWGQMSDAVFRYMNTGTMFERRAFATSIAERAEAVENLGMGEYARGLKKSFIAAFQDSDLHPPSAEDGRGGKEADKREFKMSDFDRAKSYYFAQQKKTARTKAAEGADYFATPEPVGLKMVQWLQAKKGETLMEPSGGHGAIARWFPEDGSYKVIERSMELASRLALVVDPSSVINDVFEDHHISNKYDGIAMNPPFGTSGKLAMEHLAKAFGHLRDGGRIVAIIPEGPAMDKRLNDWLTATTTSAKGVVTQAVPDARFVTYISLPASTFARAGTGVRTRVVIIDRNQGANDGTGLPHEPASTRAARQELDINELFDYIKDMDVPARQEPTAPDLSMPAPKVASVDGVTMHAHGRVIDDASKAVFRVVGDKLETDSPIAKVTTKAGKELEGVYVADRDMAMTVDKFTWRPQGQTGYFVRIKHVIRPNDAQPTMLSKVASDDAASTAGNAGTGAVISKADADDVLNRILVKVGGAIPGVTFKAVDSMAGLPAEIIAGATDPKTGKVATVKGAYDGKSGVVWLVRESHQSAQDFEQTVFHEVYGHVGIQKLYGAGITRQLSELYQRIGKRDEINALAAKHGIDLSEYWKGISEVSKNPDVLRRVMMEELLAHIAEQGPSVRQTLREILGALRAGLRGLGFAKLAGVSAADLAHILRQARAAVPTNARLRPSTVDGKPQVAFRLAGAQANTVKAKIGLLDTPMRLAFQKTGAHAVWRGAFRLLEKTAGAVLNTPMGEVIKAGLIDRYGLSDAVIERNEEMRVKMIAGVRQAETFLDRLSGLTRNEYAVLYAAANSADVATVNDLIKDLPAESQAVLHDIKALVRDLGQEAVDLKMLDVDTFKANELAYLHRSYLKHETDMTAMEQASRATRIKGDQFKQRGLADVVSTEKLMKWIPGFWGTRVKNGAVDNAVIGEQFIRFERRADLSPTENLPGIEGAPALGKLKEVVYWPVGEETPAKFGDWHREGEWTVRRTVGKNVVFRRDFTKAERERMGEIDDIRYGMAKTLHLAIHDVEVGKYFAWIADNHARIEGDLPAGAEVIDNPRKAESRLQSFTKDVWVKVPETKVTGTAVNQYGKLAGRYVPGPVWADIRAVGQGSMFDSSIGKTYEKVLRLWKISKTALSPAVHVNNVMANVVMADWHEVSGPQLLRAATVWAGQRRNPESKQLVRDFQDNGGELGNYALTELQNDQLAPLLEELLGRARQDNDMNGIVNAAQVMSLLRAGMLRQAAATFAQSKSARLAGAIPQKMIDTYQMEDQIFRLAAFIKARESGLTDREAGRYARKSFLDYNIQAPWVVAAKNSGLLPFISFSYRAIPMLYTVLRDKPWKVMKLALVLGAMSAASAAFLGLSPDDEERERRWLPDEKAGNIWGMVPKMIRMPWNTASDNPVFLDVRRFIPAGDITDTGTSHGAVPLPGFLSVGGPLALMAEIMTNKSMFTGKEIAKDTDTGAEHTRKVLDHVYKWAAPNIPLPTLGTVVPGGEPGQLQTYSWTGITNAYGRKEGTFGRDQSVPMAIGSAFGIKLEGYNPAVGQQNAKIKRDMAMKELATQQRAAGKQYGRGGLDAAEFKRKTESLQEKKKETMKEFGERANSKPRGLSDLRP